MAMSLHLQVNFGNSIEQPPSMSLESGMIIERPTTTESKSNPATATVHE
jgi:hypothetical protein